jgi:type IV pilus assembly protein PilA
MNRHTRTRGFSLLELLIVVAIILVIVAMAVPSLNKARIAANEASAANSIRTVVSAENLFYNTYGGYAPSLSALGGAAPCTPSSANACMIDNNLATGVKSGFNFSAIGSNASSTGQFQTFFVVASPVVLGTTGAKSFCAFEDGVIRVNPTGATIGNYTACQSVNPL